MTVHSSDKGLGRLLFAWKGSIWKAIWMQLVLFLFFHMAINCVYRFALDRNQQRQFHTVVHVCEAWLPFIPIQLILGFYVSYMIYRWWEQVMSIGWPDKFCTFLVTVLPGKQHENVRLTFARWAQLAQVLVWRTISSKVIKRFPTAEHVLKSGLMTAEEYEIYMNTSGNHGRAHLPLLWICNHIAELRETKVISDVEALTLTETLYAYKVCNATLAIYDWISPPLIYTQLATLATYGYFLVGMVGHQTILEDPDKNHTSKVDIYLPVRTIMEFIFYVGWLKVADEIRVPFDEDDEDFDLNYLVDRNLSAAFQTVRECAVQKPSLTPGFLATMETPMLPHTNASILLIEHIPKGRLAMLKLTDKDMEALPLDAKRLSYVEQFGAFIDIQLNRKTK